MENDKNTMHPDVEIYIHLTDEQRESAWFEYRDTVAAMIRSMFDSMNVNIYWKEADEISDFEFRLWASRCDLAPLDADDEYWDSTWCDERRIEKAATRVVEQGIESLDTLANTAETMGNEHRIDEISNPNKGGDDA